jgi:hypothetical protein
MLRRGWGDPGAGVLSAEPRGPTPRWALEESGQRTDLAGWCAARSSGTSSRGGRWSGVQRVLSDVAFVECDQLREGKVGAAHRLEQDTEGGVDLAALHGADVVAVQAGAEAERLL